MIACDESCSLKLASLLNVNRTIVKFCTSLAWCILTYVYGKYFYGLLYLFISFLCAYKLSWRQSMCAINIRVRRVHKIKYTTRLK